MNRITNMGSNVRARDRDIADLKKLNYDLTAKLKELEAALKDAEKRRAEAEYTLYREQFLGSRTTSGDEAMFRATMYVGRKRLVTPPPDITNQVHVAKIAIKEQLIHAMKICREVCPDILVDVKFTMAEEPELSDE